MGICPSSLGFGFCRSKLTSRLSDSGIKAGVINAGDELAALYLLPASDRKFENTAIDGRGNGDDFKGGDCRGPVTGIPPSSRTTGTVFGGAEVDADIVV